MRDKTHYHCGDCGHGCCESEPGFAFDIGIAFFHVHVDHDPQVVVCGDKGSDHTDQGETGESARDGGTEEIELSHHAEGWREADEGEHENGHTKGESGIFLCQASIVIDPKPASLRFFKGDHHSPRPEVAESVRRKIEQTCGNSSSGNCLIPIWNKCHEHITCMRNCRICQHALDIGLRDGDEITDDHGQRGERPKDFGQV
ncbi:MAG: hypothetical protein L6Q49_20205 [Anaerolineales bacterium]|nr:hypothetical protein [Anaerolineales bacterium]